MNERTIPYELTSLGERLDTMLATLMADVSRAQIQQWIKDGRVTDVDGKPITQSSLKLKKPLSILVTPPDRLPFAPPAPEERAPGLDIVYEDDCLLVVNKPVGLTVHPGAGQHSGTLVNMLLGHTDGNLSSMGTHERPGIVHRLDKDTSGLLVVAKTNAAHAKLAASLQKRDMKRIYQAFAWSIPNPLQGTIDAPLGRDPKNRQRRAILPGGKHAVTHYKLLNTYARVASLLECHLDTGRTHQIRVHLAHIGCPVMADPLYAGRFATRRKHLPPEAQAALDALVGQALHAAHLSFPHPVTGEILSFTAPLPPTLQALREAIEKMSL